MAVLDPCSGIHVFMGASAQREEGPVYESWQKTKGGIKKRSIACIQIRGKENP